MAVAVPTIGFRCPGCRERLEPEFDGPVACPTCAWRGEVYRFNPLAPRVDEAQEAMPDDAVCVHHPTKRAVAICEGSGSYICSLCAIDLDGKTYSAQYLEKAGKKKLGSAFVRHLERPDRSLSTALVITLFIFYLAVVTVPFSWYYLAKVVRLRRTDKLYRRVVGRGQVVAMVIILVLFSIGWVFLLIGIFSALS